MTLRGHGRGSCFDSRAGKLRVPPKTPSTHNSLVPSVPVNFFEHGAVCWEVVWQEVEKRSKIGPEKVGKWLENGRKMVFGRKMVEKSALRKQGGTKKV